MLDTFLLLPHVWFWNTINRRVWLVQYKDSMHFKQLQWTQVGPPSFRFVYVSDMCCGHGHLGCHRGAYFTDLPYNPTVMWSTIVAPLTRAYAKMFVYAEKKRCPILYHWDYEDTVIVFSDFYPRKKEKIQRTFKKGRVWTRTRKNCEISGNLKRRSQPPFLPAVISAQDPQHCSET